MVELLKALELGLEIIVVLEVEEKHLPLTRAQLLELMRKLDQPVVDASGHAVLDVDGKQYLSMYHRWGLVDKAQTAVPSSRVLTEDGLDPFLGRLPIGERLYARGSLPAHRFRRRPP